MKALKYCANGDGDLVSPPSLVICKNCRNKITENLKGIITEMEKETQPTPMKGGRDERKKIEG